MWNLITEQPKKEHTPMGMSQEYAFPQFDRQLFEDIWVEAKDIKSSVAALLDTATAYYKTNTYKVESMEIVPIAQRGGFDIYILTAR
jgi:hypothetical protein